MLFFSFDMFEKNDSPTGHKIQVGGLQGSVTPSSAVPIYSTSAIG